MTNILILSRYGRLGASSRLRAFQYVPYLEKHGYAITVAPLLGDEYVNGLYQGNRPILSVLKAYLTRVVLLLRSNQFDALWVEKELFPWIPSWLGVKLLPKMLPLVVDFDDALFHRYDQHKVALVRAVLGRKINSVIRRADLVIVGNDYLEGWARTAGAKRIEKLPTVVDTDRYAVSSYVSGKEIVIGWIGSPSTARYLEIVASALREIVASRGVRVVAVGAKSEQLKNLPIEVKGWFEESEVAEIQKFDVGIMPLPDEPWERGKCGYKLIQYMACGKPVVASPVGVNSVIVQHGVNGFLANSEREWLQAFETLCDNPALRQRMGQIGRQRTEREYSLAVTAPKLENMLRSVIRG